MGERKRRGERVRCEGQNKLSLPGKPHLSSSCPQRRCSRLAGWWRLEREKVLEVDFSACAWLQEVAGEGKGRRGWKAATPLKRGEGVEEGEEEGGEG